VKEARYVDDALNGPLPVHEPQTVALKATSNRETLPSKVAQVEVVGLNEDEMALIIKCFKTALKGRKEYPDKNKTKGKHSCFKCGKTGHFIAQCLDNDNDQEQEKHGKREKKKVYKKAKGKAHLGKEWDSDCSSSDFDDEGLAASAFNKSSLFPNERHTCLMAKEKKVSVRDSPKYTTSSDDEVDYSSLFKGRTCVRTNQCLLRERQTLRSLSGRETGGKHSSQQECDDNIKTSRAFSHGPLQTRHLP
jgi:hypothetical protein